MPPYPGNDLAKLMYENEQRFLWQQEALAVGAISKAYQLRRERGAHYPFGFSVQLACSATPGTFEIDILGSDIDQLGAYVPIGTIMAVNGVGSTFVARAEFPQAWVKYVAAYARTWPNTAVLVDLLLTR